MLIVSSDVGNLAVYDSVKSELDPESEIARIPSS